MIGVVSNIVLKKNRSSMAWKMESTGNGMNQKMIGVLSMAQ